MLLMAMLCVRSTAVTQRREPPEMVLQLIPEATAAAEVQCAEVQPLPLGVEVAARRPWFRSFLMDLRCEASNDPNTFFVFAVDPKYL